MSDNLSDRQRHEQGMAVRRAVLCDDHVQRAIAGASQFTEAFQDFITRSARARSMITLTALLALGHFEELATHVRAALRNGMTREEIGETFLHAAIYAGVPAANSAFATAQRVFAEVDSENSLADEEPS